LICIHHILLDSQDAEGTRGLEVWYQSVLPTVGIHQDANGYPECHHPLSPVVTSIPGMILPNPVLQNWACAAVAPGWERSQVQLERWESAQVSVANRQEAMKTQVVA